MRATPIPTTTLAPSALCFGTAEFGATIDRPAAFALLDAYTAAGGNFIDTAKVYGDWVPGQVSPSEKIIGQWMRARGNRGEIILATKGAHYHLDAPHVKRLKPADIISDLDASLRHLQTDVIDLYWLHRDDPARPVAELIDTLETQVRAGKIRYYGASNWRLDRLVAAQEFAQATGARGFCAVSNLWSLASVDSVALPDPTMVAMDNQLWAYHRANHLAAIPYTAQAYGVFHKLAAGRPDAVPEMYRKMFVNAATEARLARAQSLSRQTGLTLTQIILGYLLSQPFLTVPVFSARTLAQLHDTLAAADVRLPPDAIAYLTGA